MLVVVEFVLGSIALVGVGVGVLLLLGHFYEGSNADLVDWKPTRSPQVEAQNEVEDVQQMLDAQNEMRRRRGAPEIDEEKLREEVTEEELERLRHQRNRFEAI